MIKVQVNLMVQMVLIDTLLDDVISDDGTDGKSKVRDVYMRQFNII